MEEDYSDDDDEETEQAPSSSKSKIVECYDMDGNLVQMFISESDAAKVWIVYGIIFLLLCN